MKTCRILHRESLQNRRDPWSGIPFLFILIFTKLHFSERLSAEEAGERTPAVQNIW